MALHRAIISIGAILVCLSSTLAIGSNVDCGGESAVDSCKDHSVLLQRHVSASSEGEELAAQENSAKAKEILSEVQHAETDKVDDEDEESDEDGQEDDEEEEQKEASGGPRWDRTCWYQGRNKASRDASCDGDLVCALAGEDGRTFGDCSDVHCCSLPIEMCRACPALGYHHENADQQCRHRTQNHCYHTVSKAECVDHGDLWCGEVCGSCEGCLVPDGRCRTAQWLRSHNGWHCKKKRGYRCWVR